MNPLIAYGVLGAVVLAFGSSTAAYFLGRDHGRTACEAAQQQREQDAAEKIEDANKAAAGVETARQENHREIVREVPHIIERPVYLSTCFDADGVRLLNRAVVVANGEADRREPDAAPSENPGNPPGGNGR